MHDFLVQALGRLRDAADVPYGPYTLAVSAAEQIPFVASWQLAVFCGSGFSDPLLRGSLRWEWG